MKTPSYLQEYSALYQNDLRAAALKWFREAKYGLFLHYGLYSLTGRHEWVQLKENIPVAQYGKLKDQFTAENFDAEKIAQLAIDSGMKYVNLTTRHHECFCLWDTAHTDFNSVNSPCGRDLVGELAQACDRHGLGLFLYYSHGRDWRHPHAPNNDEWGGNARPQYDPPEPTYCYGDEHDLNIYVDFMKAQVTELLSNYGPIAGIWLDGISVPLHDKVGTPYPQKREQTGNAPAFRTQELYDLIHALQPQTLVAYKQGLLGTEDFYAPEHHAIGGQEKPGEVCTTLCNEPNSWGYLEAGIGKHRGADELWEVLGGARRAGFNLLTNTGPLPDGSLDAEDAATLRAVGERLRREGFPSEIGQ